MSPGKPSERSLLSKVLLDKISVQDIHEWEVTRDRVLRFHWDYYSNLAYQRAQVADQLRAALLDAAEGPYHFSRWHRVVKYKRSLEPLADIGSITDPGGRFNIGNINPHQFPPFTCLYVAKDRITALQEVLSQSIPSGQEDRALDAALTNNQSISDIALNGGIDTIVNLRHRGRLRAFIDCMRHFTIPNALIQEAEEIGLPRPRLIAGVTGLVNTFLEKDWRDWPMQFDIPHPAQIFGQLVVEAGISGILYPSKFSQKNCLAIFSKNFDPGSESFVELADEAPDGIETTRLSAPA